jgi:colanic acid/amylovoran biosynthesis glycosyltransferase
MATGLPVIATLHGGIPEAVRNGITGILVPERDREGLFDSMMKLTNNAPFWQSVSRAATADMLENFESKTQIAKLEAAYAEALKLVA